MTRKRWSIIAGFGITLAVGGLAYLAGDLWVHISEAGSEWVGDDLHLLTICSRTGNWLFTHDVIIRQHDNQ